MKAAYEITMVKENLNLSLALIRAVQNEKVTAEQIFRDGPEDLFVAFAVNKNGPDQAELTRRVANQARAAFALAVIQTQRSLDRVFSNPPLEEENPDLQAARCVMHLLYNAVSPNLFTPVWDCPPEYRRQFEVRPINLLVDADGLHGKGVSWDHVGGLLQFLSLLEYFSNRIKILPEIGNPAFTAPTVAAESVPVEAPEPEDVVTSGAPGEKIDGPVARFIAKRCDIGSHFRTTARELYAGFLEWCRETGRDDLSQRSFGMQLTATGLHRRRRGRGKHWWEGIRLSGSTRDMAGDVAGKVTAGSLELTNGHREGYQTESAR